jgi:hypothetical protein
MALHVLNEQRQKLVVALQIFGLLHQVALRQYKKTQHPVLIMFKKQP